RTIPLILSFARPSVTCSYAGSVRSVARSSKQMTAGHATEAGKSAHATAASAEATGTPASTTSVPARHVMATAVTPAGLPALAATVQAALPWTQPPSLGRDEDSHETRASLVS